MSIRNCSIEIKNGNEKQTAKKTSFFPFVQNKSKTKNLKKPFILQKDIILIFVTLATFFLFFVRFNLSVGIVAMLQDEVVTYVNKTTNQTLELDSNYLENLYLNQTLNQTLNQDQIIKVVNKKFNWSPTVQGLILSSYFYSYFLFQVPCGMLSEAFGSRWVLFSGIFIPAIVSFIIPWATTIGYIFLIILRIVMGCAHASVICSCYTLISKWMSEEEKLRSIIFLNIGFEVGGMATLVTSGYICSNKYLGWDYTFYFAGLLSIIYCIPYLIYVYSEPEQSPKLTNYDRKLNESIKVQALSRDEFSKRIKRIKPKLSLKTLLTSGPVWASCCAKFFGEYGYYLIIIKMPGYMNDVFNVSLIDNGFFCAVPYVGITISKLICIKLARNLQQRKLMSLTRLRITFQTISMITPAICLFAVTIFNHNQYVVVLLIFFAMMGKGFTSAGDAAIVADFARDLSGSVFGYTNMFACFNGILAPILTAKVLETFPDKLLAWNINFYIVSSFFIIGSIIFMLFASAEPQQWAVEKFVEMPYSISETNNPDLRKKHNQSES